MMRPSRLWPGLVALAAVAILGASAYVAFVFVPRERAAAVASCRAERQSAADKRQSAIGMWVGSRLEDAELLASQASVRRLVAQGNRAPAPVRAEVGELLTAAVTHHGFRRAIVADSALHVLAAGAGESVPTVQAPLEAARPALSGRGVADLVRHVAGEVDAVFVRPVLVPGAAGRQTPALGLVMVVDDPGRWLYPYMARHLGNSTTAESLLVRREGDDMLFLTPLRFDPAPPLTLRRSLATPGLEAVAALRGRVGFHEYHDYRGVRVLGDVRPIAATGWALVTKIDTDDALAAFHTHMRSLTLEVGGLVMGLLGLGFLARRAELAAREVAAARDAARLNERFRVAALSVSDVVYEWDLKDRVAWHDAGGFLGFAPGEYPRTAAYHVATIHPEDRERVMTAVQRHLDGSAPYDVEYRAQRRDGSYAWLAVRGTAVRDAGGRPGYWIGAITDISRRKSDQERLVHVNAVLRAVRAVNQIIVRETDRRVLLQRVCDSLVQTRGYRSAWIAVLDGDDAGFLASAGLEVAGLAASLRDGQPPACARLALASDAVVCVPGPARDCPCAIAGEARDSSCLAARLAPGGRALGVLGVLVPSRFADDGEERGLLQELADDVALALAGIEASARQRQAEAALAASERKYRHFFEQELAGHYVSTREGRLLSCNSAFARLLGFASADEAIGVDVVSLYPTAEARRDFLERLRTDGRVDRLETEMRRRDGTRVAVVESAVEVSGDGTTEIHGFLIDDSERRRAQEESLRAQKMEAVGRLAGGVAHDFNNLLGVILGHAELVEQRQGLRHPEAFALEQIRLAAERGARLTRQLLAFGRKQVLQPRRLDLNAVVRNMVPMLTPLLGEGIELETRLAEGLGRVKADEGQIEQALLNLAVNARDAMPRGGRIVIETANRDPHPAARDAGTGAAGGGFVAISVSDTGHGMDAVTLSHLFEPFFTTKAAEKGTGLGLASVYGIVQQSGGRIDVQSAPGQGTCFLISLPRTMGDAEPTLPLRSVAGSGGHETLLLVEDDEALRSVTREILEAAGYRVLAASRPDDAARVSLEHGERIDLLLSDVVMPSRSGPELAAELLSRRPELRVLYTSGYTSDAAALQGLAESGARLLQKPFTSAELLREVRAALDQAPPPTS